MYVILNNCYDILNNGTVDTVEYVTIDVNNNIVYSSAKDAVHFHFTTQLTRAGATTTGSSRFRSFSV